MSLFQELKRRNVFRVGLAYLVGAWLVLQLTEVLSELLKLPDQVGPVVVALVIIGFPLALLFAWAFELTPEGVRRERDVGRSASITGQTARRLNRVLMALLVIAVAYFAIDRFVLNPPAAPGRTTAVEEAPEPEEGPASTPLPDDRSIAVMPLKLISQAGEGDVFASGIHSGLVNQLAQIPSLRLVSRASTERVAGQGLPPREIAGLLNVAHLLEGEVQRAGDSIRVSLQLVDARDDNYLWAETYDRQLTARNLFVIQDEIARAVAEALEATLTTSEGVRLAETPTQDLEALELYFRGQALLDERTESSLEAARSAFNAARTRDPAFGQAFAAEANAILLLGANDYAAIPRPEALALAQPLVDRAVALAPEDALVLAARGQLAQRNFRYEEAAGWYRRSLERNPADWNVINWLRANQDDQGEWSEVLELVRRATRADPLSVTALSSAVRILSQHADSDPTEIDALFARLERIDPAGALQARADIAFVEGRLVEAARLWQETLVRDPTSTIARNWLARLLVRLELVDAARALGSNVPEFEFALGEGDWSRALALAQADFDANPEDPGAVSGLAIALFWAGRGEETLNMGLVAWESLQRNPFAWGPDSLTALAALARRYERPGVVEEFKAAARKQLDRARSLGREFWTYELADAQLASLENRLPQAVEHLGRAIDLGFRGNEILEHPLWEMLADQLGFREQLRRLDELIAQEQREVLDILCSPGGLLVNHEDSDQLCA